ncbi:16S rRNA (cytidine1402-2'-O)-methyltransferase [Litchfieldia salsa]|uniref:Ribosomal RNA small subunit methyltransferase I n=2 Tax=Litchfieldia salsa TaxID=930152 RepID=A0A1H0WZH1_9BACI|nr:16S rRNA (cytidine1402-2'-O)-methyltransferase [Litchfieldia salsa]
MMWQQKSFQSNSDFGTLYLVPTPIGNLEDMTFRAIKTLKEVDIIAAEDTRHSKKLCNYFEITTPIISYHDHNKEVSGEKIVGLLKEGKNIALISDAGLPTISDPGYELVVEAVSQGLYVVPLPGANAALTAMIASGLSTQPFYFFGFLNRQKKEKKVQLERLKRIEATIIFYEAPHRLKETLLVMKEILGNRKVCISRELTKKFEEFIRGDLDSVIEWSKDDQIRGEFCLILEGANYEDLQEEVVDWWAELSIEDHINHYIEKETLSAKDAIKEVAKQRQLPKREVYNIFHH